MDRKRSTSGLVAGVAFALGAVLWQAPARAHHSFAQFQMDRSLEIRGTVKDWDWGNPHSWLTLIVRDQAGAESEWRLEGESIGELTRAGWGRTTLRKGDAVAVVYHPLKSGEAGGGALFSVTTPDGKTYTELRR